MIYEIDGVKILNCTPHEIRFQNSEGNIVVVEKSGYTLPAKPIEDDSTYLASFSRLFKDKVTLVKTKFLPSEQGHTELKEVWDKFGNDVIIVGSIISAQAYPGLVVSLVPVPGTERAAPADKLYLANKFNIF